MCSKCVDITFNWKLRDLHLTGDNMLHVILQTMSITSKKFRFVIEFCMDGFALFLYA